MATINAKISVVSNDLTSSPLNLTKTMTMTKAGSCNGLELTSGLVQRLFTSANQVDLITAGAQNYGTPTASTVPSANKLYIRNIGSPVNAPGTSYVTIGLGTSSGSGTATTDNVDGTAMTIGRLYDGDWMLIPFHGTATVGDVWIQPMDGTTTGVEYILFFE